jgi:hypothetical protein
MMLPEIPPFFEFVHSIWMRGAVDLSAATRR